MSNEQIRQRQENLEALVRLGMDPNPYRYQPTHAAAQVLAGFDALQVQSTLYAWTHRLG